MKKAVVVVLTLCVFAFAAFATVDDGLRFAALAKYYLKDRYLIPPRTEYENHPFLTSVLKPNQVVILPHYPGNGGGMLDLRTNSLGFRSPQFSARKPAGVYRIVVVGGSAAVTGSDDAHTIPGLLRAALDRRAAGQRRYEVIDAGMPGFTSTQELFLTATQVITWHPDLVIVYDGRNDMFNGSLPSYRPNRVPRNDQVMAFLRQPAPTSPSVDRLPFLYTLYRSHIRALATPADPSLAFDTPEGARFAYTPHPEAVDVYRDNLRSLIAIVRDRRARAALVYQPTLLHRTALGTKERAIVAGLAARYVAAMRTMLPLGERAMREVAQHEGVPMADLTAVFDHTSSTMFIDDVHQTDAGNAVIADRIYALVRPLLPGNERQPGK